MIAPLGILTTGIKIKAATLATALFFSSVGGVSGLDTALVPATKQSPLTNVCLTQEKIALPDRDGLWRYLRSGLNYLEASGIEVPIEYVHPGGVAFGPLALTRVAVKDVLLHVSSMADYTIDEVLADGFLYEKCAALYADLLLRHYLKIDTDALTREEIFEILQKAWFLGPTLYKRGQTIPLSRAENARRYRNAS